jgi:EAL domain-containing protein (putative c-di-GMP-specific phosphodiesterase class I)/CheY-like chemotaxis protein
MTRSGPIRVLVAEDDPAVRSALASLIDSEQTLLLGSAVADAAEAIEAATRDRPDVAIVDVRMPGGGAAAARGIRRRSESTKVVAYSAHDDRATVLEMLEAGAVGYLVKGASAEEIIDSIQLAARGRGSLSTQVEGSIIEELTGQLRRRRRSDDARRRREKRIARVLEEREISMHYQPICTLHDSAVVGLEALARFDGRPERGPDRWFAEARDVGRSTELELATIELAVEDLAQLPDGLYLSINVSPDTILTRGFRTLMEGVDATRIVLEVTEHAPIGDYKRLSIAIESLRQGGIRLAVDDAGAGFASLRHILELAPDIIKLDRTLIDGIDRDRPQQALAAGLTSFAARMETTIVAEGIERPEEVATLRALGVSHGQGFLLARPAPLQPA